MERELLAERITWLLDLHVLAIMECSIFEKILRARSNKSKGRIEAVGYPWHSARRSAMDAVRYP